MSRYKNQFKNILKTIRLEADNVLSIGGQVDDKEYFKFVLCKNWQVMDINPDFKPDIVWDINKPLVFNDDLQVPDDMVEKYNAVLGLNLWEYIYDPVTAHRNIAAMLRPGGWYIGSYVFVYPQHEPAGTDYLRYTPEAVEKYLKVAGLNLDQTHYIQGDILLLDYYAADQLKARKQADHLIIGTVVIAKKP